VEIASREFMDNLTSLLEHSSSGVNSEVKAKMLELIQSWAGATEGRHDLVYIGEVYRTLQREGYHFPPKQTVSSSMIDSSAVSRGLDGTAPSVPQVDVLTDIGSPRSGQIPMFVCDAARRSHLRTESTTAETVATASTISARPRWSLSLISEY
jgi:hypothetical protein